MRKIDIKGLALWQFQQLERVSGLRHFVTDRNANVHGRPFTLSYSSTPDKDEVRSNRKLLAESMGVAETMLFFPSQVHQTRIHHVTPDTDKADLMETDALITSHRGLCIAVMSADCVPILLWDPKNKIVAAVHSGWKGTVARILEKTLQDMHSSFGTNGADVFAAIGPSVSQESYEVGVEVVEAVTAAYNNPNDLLIPLAGKKAKLDLWKANRQQLLEFGVPSSQIEVSDLCTVIHNQSFFSARKGDTGRFAAGIMMV